MTGMLAGPWFDPLTRTYSERIMWSLLKVRTYRYRGGTVAHPPDPHLLFTCIPKMNSKSLSHLVLISQGLAHEDAA